MAEKVLVANLRTSDALNKNRFSPFALSLYPGSRPVSVTRNKVGIRLIKSSIEPNRSVTEWTIDRFEGPDPTEIDSIALWEGGQRVSFLRSSSTRRHNLSRLLPFFAMENEYSERLSNFFFFFRFDHAIESVKATRSKFFRVFVKIQIGDEISSSESFRENFFKTIPKFPLVPRSFHIKFSSLEFELEISIFH